MIETAEEAKGTTASEPPASRACFLIARSSSRMIRLLPRRLCEWGGDRVADAAFLTSRRYRANSLANLRQVVGPEVSADRVRLLARQAFRTSVHNMIDLLRFQGPDAVTLDQLAGADRPDWSILDCALAQGRGVVLVTAHLGAFDGLGRVLAASGYRLTVVVGRTLTRAIFDAAVALRRALGVEVVEASPTGVRRMIASLRRGECVGFPADRDFFHNGVPVEFFGRRTSLPSGAVRLAREAGAPIVAAYLRRAGAGFDLTLEGPFVVPRTADRRADVAAGMDAIVASLTRAVAATPGQWAVFQPVWPGAGTDGRRCGSSS
jgi:KDO2-lipid IV(A) lauroyltransferase